MITRSLFVIPTALLAGLFAYGCQDTPRNGLLLTTPAPTTTFNGYSQYAGTQVQIQTRDRSVSNKWDTIANTTAATSSNPSTDAVGYKWFAYSRAVTLPMTPKYWAAATTVSGQRRIKAEVRSYTAQEAALYTFDTSDQQCIEDNVSAGGAAIVLNCNAEGARVATVSLNCGKSGQACCAVNATNASRFCDSGLICGNANTCIAAGGLNQPCSINETFACDASGSLGEQIDCVDGPSASPSSSGTCRDVSVERTPIISLELKVYTCDAASAPTTAPKYVSLQSGNNYYLDKPGSETVRNTPDSWGIVNPAIKKLGDIDVLRIALGGSVAQNADDWCFNRVDLIVNGTRVLRRDYPSGQWIGGSNQASFQVIGPDDLRRAMIDLGSATMCALPTAVTFDQLQHMVEGGLGDMFTRSTLELVAEGDDPKAFLRFDAKWSSGFVNVTRVNASDVRIATRFRITNEYVRDASSNPIFDLPTFDVVVNVSMIARFDCDWEAETTTVCPPPPATSCTTRLDTCSTDFQNFVAIESIVADNATPIISEFIEWVVETTLEDTIDKQLDQMVSFRQMFSEAEGLVCDTLSTPQLPLCDDGQVCGCPGMTVSTTGIAMNWSRFGVPAFNLNVLPFPMCH